MRTLVFGGSFDPPHRGHLAMARLALRRVPCDRVLFAPLNAPCHKAGPRASYVDRCAMVALLLGDEEGMELTGVDGELGGTTYTWRTLETLLAGPCRGDELFFLMGADSLEELPTWRRWEHVLELARPVVMARPGHRLVSPGLSPAQLERVIVVPGFRSSCSSTLVRSRLASGRSCRCLTGPVLAFIRGHGLYDVGAPSASVVF